MVSILLHSSKSMRLASPADHSYQQPPFLNHAEKIDSYLKSLSIHALQDVMKLSEKKATETHDLIASWTSDQSKQQPAIDAFLGDIYSGLQVASLDDDDRQYANSHLFILSGLYGLLRALDSIHPYRLEMGYRLQDDPYKNLEFFWSDKLASALPSNDPIVNLSAVEYTKALLPYVNKTVVTPKFLTRNTNSGEPTFVTVHAKIARGAFAHWMIARRITSLDDLSSFDELHYCYDKTLSTDFEPVFVCDQFGGIGMSVRLT